MDGAHDRAKLDEMDFVKDAAGGLRNILDRIGEFFHLFDLSFFVSGTATFSAIVYWFSRQETALVPILLPSWVYVVGLAVACYICGLLSFAAGSIVTKQLRKGLPDLLEGVLRAHCADTTVKPYLENRERAWRLYERLWVEVRQTQKCASSFSLLSRYWVMAATYNGLAISCFVWAVILLAEPPIVQSSYANFLLPLLAVGCGGVSLRQAGSYFENQVYELVATLVGSKTSLNFASSEQRSPKDS